MTVDELVKKLRQFDGGHNVAVAFGNGSVNYPVKSVWMEVGHAGKRDVVINI